MGLAFLGPLSSAPPIPNSSSSEFEAPFRVRAGEDYISVDKCHAAPVYEDIDGDGLKELLVGQFQEGRIRLYPNYGTNAAPVFKEFEWLKAGDEVLKLPAG